MDIKTLRSKTKEELLHELEQAKVHLKELQFKNSASQLKQVRQIRETKKTIARIQTLLSQ
jgi:large subunit ribosomal protein L29